MEPPAQALVIGVSRYLHVSRLRTTRDAPGVRDVLASPDCGGYPADAVVVLEEEAATRDGVLAALEAMCERASQPGSRTLFYFSGHGGQDADGRSYLLPVDAIKGAYATTAISARELSQRFARCAGELTIVLDCCRAAGLASDDPAPALAPFGDPLRRELQAQNRVILAASCADGRSYVSPDAPYGIFTGHLLDGLRGEASTGGGDVTVHQLFDYVQKHVMHAAGDAQRPVFIANIEAFYPLTRYPRPIEPRAVFDRDVYLSYDRDDPGLQDWVAHRLAPELAAGGCTIYADDDLGYHQLAVEQAISTSRYVVALLTPGYLANRMAEFNTMMAVLQAIHTRTPRFIPIVREPCRVPLYVQSFSGLDMSPRKEMRFRDNLNRLIKRLRKQPDER